MTVTEAIQKAKANNQLAFNVLLYTYWSQVYAYQLKRTENENDAEDITIQTFAKAFDKIHSYNSSFAFSTWLITISKNLHIDMLRKAHRRIVNTTTHNGEYNDIADSAPTPEDKIITEQNLANLLKNIKLLKPHYQEIIHLRFFQELSYKEISETLNEPLSTIKVKLLRSKKLLAEIITKS